jgi:hypothetical protein
MPSRAEPLLAAFHTSAETLHAKTSLPTGHNISSVDGQTMKQETEPTSPAAQTQDDIEKLARMWQFTLDRKMTPAERLKCLAQSEVEATVAALKSVAAKDAEIARYIKEFQIIISAVDYSTVGLTYREKCNYVFVVASAALQPKADHEGDKK